MFGFHLYQGRLAELRNMIGIDMELGDAIDTLIAYTAAQMPEPDIPKAVAIDCHIQVVAYERLETLADYVGKERGKEQQAFERFFLRCVEARMALGQGRLSVMAWIALAPEAEVIALARRCRPPSTCRTFAPALSPRRGL
jgi:hypothetical protein